MSENTINKNAAMKNFIMRNMVVVILIALIIGFGVGTSGKFLTWQIS